MEEKPKVISNPNEVLCYNKYKCPRLDGKISIDGKKLKMEAIPMRRIDAENYNAVTNDSGVIFVLNEEATEKYKEYEANRKAERKAKKFQKTQDAKELLAEVIDSAVKAKTAKKEETNEPTLKELQAQCESYPKKEWQGLKKAELVEYLKSKEA